MAKFDWSKTLIRCSSIYTIMAGESKSSLSMYNDAVDELALKENRYSELKNKDTKTAIKLLEAITSLNYEMPILYAQKDEESLSEGCKTYLKTIYALEKYGKWSTSRDIGNKYTTKGKLVEDESIDLISWLDKKDFNKNEEKVFNEFISGTPDIFEGESIKNAERVIDVKSSWDIGTFFYNLGKPLDKKYWWQIQGYLALTNAKEGEVSFCLISTPDGIINGEKYKLFNRMNPLTDQAPEYLLAEAELVNNMTFDDIPMAERRIRFTVERDDDAMQKVYKKVAKCREYLAEIEEMHEKFSK